MLEVKRLRLLRELSSRGTVIAVAEALNYSPSAVSQQLSQLEREVGVPLFQRSGRHLALTATAKYLAAEADDLLSHIERIESGIRRHQGTVSGTVRVAAFQTVMLALLPQVLDRLRTEHPNLRIDVVQHEPETAHFETWARGFDLVIAEEYPGHATVQFSGLDRQPLTRDRIQLAVPAGRPEFDAVATLADAAGLPWVMEPRRAASRHWAEQLCRSAGFEPDVRFETADLQAHVRLIESGNAVALLPGLVHAGRRPELRLVDLPGDPLRSVFTAARSSQGDDPALSAVRAALAAEAAVLAP
ncbi:MULTISPECIES: LysR family transcriptional regulator [unclassified Gordonia (in: high G+C Gram-positive bacteria)]|uniref:LysR family transcriptional regulator n=1 Tax=unclassified Gordonia (in: high G+C Gram-positive bacteria) TaxID=2657482 RepID=UPI001FFF95E3|nr:MULTISPECIES: LysR substrate-binding domain-containing protein [unclassified Gordonia (in: high G+C Gram-positive bacteria)]UQE73923.1 LysR substrate-binding domain-containing protein [Gordonia sp. PP30]